MTRSRPTGLADGELTIAISTIGARLHQVILPAPTTGCRLLVLAQEAPSDALMQLSENRPDVRVIPLPGRGVAASRHAALNQAQTEFLLFGDDDVTLDMAAVMRMRDHLQAHPGQAMAVGQLGGARRNAPHRQGPLRRTNAGRIGTPTLMIRLAPFHKAGIGFDLRFGLGARYPLGEEFIFVADALSAGLKGVHLPLVIGDHPAPSSGDDWADPAKLRARGAALHRAFGALSLPYALGFVWRHRARIGGMGGMLRLLVQSFRPL